MSSIHSSPEGTPCRPTQLSVEPSLAQFQSSPVFEESAAGFQQQHSPNSPSKTTITAEGSALLSPSAIGRKLLPPWASSLFSPLGSTIISPSSNKTDGNHLSDTKASDASSAVDPAAPARKQPLPQAKVVVVGPPSSGRTAMAKAVSTVASRGLFNGLRSITLTLGDDGVDGSSITYKYTSKLSRHAREGHSPPTTEITVVDSGCAPSASSSVDPDLTQADVVLILVPLLIPSRKDATTSISEVLMRSSDAAETPRMLSLVASRVNPEDPPPLVILVATFLDVISSAPTEAVRVGLVDMRRIYNTLLSSWDVPCVIDSCFAVSLTSGTCVSDTEKGPVKLAGLWHIVCEAASDCVAMEKVRVAAAAASSTTKPSSTNGNPTALLTSAEKRSWSTACRRSALPALQMALLSEAKGEGANNGSTQHYAVGIHPVLGALADQSEKGLSRLSEYLKKMSADEKVFFIGLERLWKTAFSYGVPSMRLLYALLRVLESQGELVFFQRPPIKDGCRGTQSCILVKPLLIRQCLTAVYGYSVSATSTTFADSNNNNNNRVLLTAVDRNLCKLADPENYAALGLFRRKLLNPLASHLKRAGSSEQAGDLLAAVLILTDTAFELQSIAPGEVVGGCSPAQSQNQNKNRHVDPSPDSSDANPILSLSSSARRYSIFCAPALMPVAFCPMPLVHCVREQLTVLSESALNIAVASWCLELCAVPVDFFPMLTCRLGALMRPIRMFTNALWLEAMPPKRRSAGRRKSLSSKPERLRVLLHHAEVGFGRSLLQYHILGECSPLAVALCEGDIIRQIKLLCHHRLPGVMLREMPYQPVQCAPDVKALTVEELDIRFVQANAVDDG